MASAIARSSWTGTRGIVDGGLPDDWEEAYALLGGFEEPIKFTEPRVDYTPKIVERAWAWLLKEFGEEAAHADLSIRFVVELYLES